MGIGPINNEMDKIGAPVNGKGGGFYTREDWGQKDQPNLGVQIITRNT